MIHTWYDVLLLAIAFALCDGILWLVRTVYYKWYWRRWYNDIRFPVAASASNYDWTWLVVVAIWLVFLLFLRREREQKESQQ